MPDSPRCKNKQKINKGRISVNTSACQQKNSGVLNNKISHTKNASLEAEKLSMMNKSRPRSAKSKTKENAPKTAGKRSKKNSVKRHQHNNSVISKLDFPLHKGLDNSFLTGENSNDNTDKAFQKFIKKQTSKQNKSITKMRVGTVKQTAKIQPNKFALIKRPDAFHKNLHKAYEHMNYFEDLSKMHSNIEEIMKENKHIMKYDTKKNKLTGISKKSKHKRCATPGLSAPQAYLDN